MKLQGTYIVLAVLVSGVYTPIAYGRGCNVSTSRDFIETASTTSGTDRESIPSRMSFSVECQTLMSDDMTTLETMFRTRQSIYFRLYDNTDAYSRQYRGRAYISSLKQSAQLHEMATAQLALKGTDALDYATYNVVRLRDKYGTPLCDKNGVELYSYTKD